MCTQDGEVLTQASLPLPHSCLALVPSPFEFLILFLFRRHSVFKSFVFRKWNSHSLKEMTPSLVRKNSSRWNARRRWQNNNTHLSETHWKNDMFVLFNCFFSFTAKAMLPSPLTLKLPTSLLELFSCIYSEVKCVRKAKNMQCLPPWLPQTLSSSIFSLSFLISSWCVEDVIVIYEFSLRSYWTPGIKARRREEKFK